MDKEVAKIEQKRYILNQVLSHETKICRYMGLDVFLQLLGGVFYVPRKLSFLDARESGKIPLKYLFRLQNVSNPEIISQKIMNNEQIETNQHKNNLYKSKFLLTSCWACDHGEDYLMWKSYTNDTIGVCVRTTIDKLMQAIKYDKKGYIPICSPMFYQQTTPNIDFMESMFSKEPFYVSEDELRIYFIPKEFVRGFDMNNIDNTIVKRLLIETIEHEEKLHEENKEKYPMNITFDIDPNFIDSVVLSPFIKPKTFKYFGKAFAGEYAEFFEKKISIKPSEISIK